MPGAVCKLMLHPPSPFVPLYPCIHVYRLSRLENVSRIEKNVSMQLGYGTVYTARAARSRIPPISLLVSFPSSIILTAERTFPFPPSLLLLTLMLFTLLHLLWLLVAFVEIHGNFGYYICNFLW